LNGIYRVNFNFRTHHVAEDVVEPFLRTFPLLASHQQVHPVHPATPQQLLHQHLPQEAGPAGDEDGPVSEQFCDPISHPESDSTRRWRFNRAINLQHCANALTTESFDLYLYARWWTSQGPPVNLVGAIGATLTLDALF
jgi:hypothetical protein